jgi:mannose-6-phosphate isomerase
VTAVPLTPAVRTYAWGSRTVLPALLGEPTPSAQPWAEIWVGAHPADPSRLPDGRSLAEVEPALPYLVKLLAAEHALSIQAHPDREQAQAGFAAEEARGVPVDAPERSYRDRSHKPELLVALTPTDALVGFRPVDEIVRLVRVVGAPRLSALADATVVAGQGFLRAVFAGLLHLRGTEAGAALVAEVAERCAMLGPAGPDGLAAGWVTRLAEQHPGDPGAVLPLVLRLLPLQPGEGVFVSAGQLHAYLHGSGVEFQAASDNVLRGGLTPKHVDVDELLAVVRFEPAADAVVRPRPLTPGLAAYDVPVVDFAVRRVNGGAGAAAVTVDLTGPRLVLCVAGTVGLDGVELTAGRAAYVPGGDVLRVTGPGICFVAGPG